MVTVCADAAVPQGTSEKSRLVGATLTAGGVPVPARVIGAGSGAQSGVPAATVKVAASAYGTCAVGRNVAVKVVDVAETTTPGDGVTSNAAVAWVNVTLADALPALVTENCWDAEVVATTPPSSM